MKHSYIFLLLKTLLLIIILSAIESFGQNKVDSINSILQQGQLPQEKTLELNILLAKEYAYSNTLEAKSILTKQLQNQEIANYPILHTEALLNLGLVYKLTGDKVESMSAYLKAIDIAKKHNLQSQLIKSYSYTGVISMDFQLYEQSLKYLRMSLNLLRANSTDRDRLGEIYSNIGTCFQNSNQEDSAIYYYQQALNYYRSVDNQEDLAVALDNIGQLYESAGFHNKSKILFEEAEKINRKYQNNYHLVGNLNNLALYYKNHSLFDSSLLIFREIDSISLANGLKKDRAINFYNKANVLYAKEKYSKAFINYDSSLKICKEIHLDYGIMLISSHKARILVIHGMEQEAEELWEEAKKISEANAYLSFPTQLEGLKAEAYELVNNYKKALEANNKKRLLEDSAESDKQKKLISSLIKYYEVDIKNREIIHHEIKIKQKNTLLIIISIAFIIILILVLILFRKFKVIRNKNEVLLQQLKNNLRITPERMTQLDSNISHTLSDEIYDKFVGLLMKESPYLDPQISRSKLASTIGTNEKYLSQALKEKTSLGLTEILNRRRICQAIKNLSEDPQVSMQILAVTSGFTSERTFYRVFKKTTGFTPSEFKRIPADKKNEILNQFEL